MRKEKVTLAEELFLFQYLKEMSDEYGNDSENNELKPLSVYHTKTTNKDYNIIHSKTIDYVYDFRCSVGQSEEMTKLAIRLDTWS